MAEPDYQALAKRLIGRPLKDANLLETAFTHRSFLNENKHHVSEHNERLEFLGDAVLELIVTEYLYINHDQPEGILTNWRSSLVRTESLSAVADRLGFADYLRLSRGERQGSSRALYQILANAVEAFIGAIYLDQGYEVTKKFISDNIIVTLDEIIQTGSWMDPKTRLQEQIQSREGLTPVYRVLKEAGPDHDKLFLVGVYIGDKLRGEGQGYSKQMAQQAAAQAALKQLG